MPLGEPLMTRRDVDAREHERASNASMAHSSATKARYPLPLASKPPARGIGAPGVFVSVWRKI
jgi:hypothetical protein